ncbi:MAG TPA: hypothetical protein PLG47_03920 [Candidatus Dojkabacteria bacterium]|nr:hypothetical protein [Candidatus Dojkabacteria bacterium]
MNILKKIWYFSQANSNAIIVVELVIIISLVIKHLDVKLINDTIIPIAYLVSIYFIYKAFKENQKSNIIEVGKVLYEKFLSDIVAIENMIDRKDAFQHIFYYNQTRIELKSNEIFEMHSKVKKILQFLKNIPEYQDVNDRIRNKDETLLNSHEVGVSFLAYNYTALHKILTAYSSHMLSFWSVYDSIYHSRNSMAQEYITLLVERLMIYFHGYKLICRDIYEENHYFDSTFLVLRDIPLPVGKVDDFKQYTFSKIYPNNFTWVYETIGESESKLKLNFK